MSNFTNPFRGTFKRVPTVVAVLALAAAITIPNMMSAIGASTNQSVYTIGAPCAAFDTRFADFDGDGIQAQEDADESSLVVSQQEVTFYVSTVGDQSTRTHRFWDDLTTTATEAHQGASQDGTDARANPDGCGVPPDAESIFVNINSVNPTGPGNLRAFPPGTPDEDKGGVLIYDANDSVGIANGLILEFDGGNTTGELIVQVNGSDTAIRGVITGYTCNPATATSCAIVPTS